MLLQQIILQLDGELFRLKSLRGIVAGLAGSPSMVSGLPRRSVQAAPMEAVLAVPVPAAAAPGTFPHSQASIKSMESVAFAEPATLPRTARGRGRPRKPTSGGDGWSTGEAAPSKRVASTQVGRVGRLARRAEPTALSKASSVGPVVMSAAALAQERQARGAARADSNHRNLPEAAPEVRPEAFARELAARWLTGSNKE